MMNETKFKYINKHWSLLEIYLAYDMEDYTGRTCLLCSCDGMKMVCSFLHLRVKIKGKEHSVFALQW